MGHRDDSADFFRVLGTQDHGLPAPLDLGLSAPSVLSWGDFPVESGHALALSWGENPDPPVAASPAPPPLSAQTHRNIIAAILFP